jgi:hypothetical protein
MTDQQKKGFRAFCEIFAVIAIMMGIGFLIDWTERSTKENRKTVNPIECTTNSVVCLVGIYTNSYYGLVKGMSPVTVQVMYKKLPNINVANEIKILTDFTMNEVMDIDVQDWSTASCYYKIKLGQRINHVFSTDDILVAIRIPQLLTSTNNCEMEVIK